MGKKTFDFSLSQFYRETDALIKGAKSRSALALKVRQAFDFTDETGAEAKTRQRSSNQQDDQGTADLPTNTGETLLPKSWCSVPHSFSRNGTYHSAPNVARQGL
jgi:uncharacterized protein YycO